MTAGAAVRREDRRARIVAGRGSGWEPGRRGVGTRARRRARRTPERGLGLGRRPAAAGAGSATARRPASSTTAGSVGVPVPHRRGEPVRCGGGGGDDRLRRPGRRGLGRRVPRRRPAGGLGRPGSGDRRGGLGDRAGSGSARPRGAGVFALGFLARGLLGRLLRRLGLFGLLVPGQAVTDSATADHVGVRLVERRRMALHGHAEDTAEVDDLWHWSCRVPWPVRVLGCSSPRRQSTFRRRRRPHHRFASLDASSSQGFADRHGRAPGPFERLAADGQLEASPGHAQPSATTGPVRSTTARSSSVSTQRTRADGGRR